MRRERVLKVVLVVLGLLFCAGVYPLALMRIPGEPSPPRRNRGRKRAKKEVDDSSLLRHPSQLPEESILLFIARVSMERTNSCFPAVYAPRSLGNLSASPRFSSEYCLATSGCRSR